MKNNVNRLILISVTTLAGVIGLLLLLIIFVLVSIIPIPGLSLIYLVGNGYLSYLIAKTVFSYYSKFGIFFKYKKLAAITIACLHTAMMVSHLLFN